MKGVLVFVLVASACGPSDVRVDETKLGGECKAEGDPRTACPQGEACYQIVKVPTLRCAKTPARR